MSVKKTSTINQIDHESFLLSLISRGIDSEDDPLPTVLIGSGMVSMDGRSPWLVARLSMSNEVEDPEDLAVLSASSFLKVSSSRSNLDKNLINNCRPSPAKELTFDQRLQCKNRLRSIH